MTRLFSTIALLTVSVALSGCEMTLPGAPEAAAPQVAPEVIAALPPGVPPSIVFETADGCYAYAIEVTEPMQGFRLRDRNGNVICKPGSVPVDAAPTPAEATS